MRLSLYEDEDVKRAHFEWDAFNNAFRVWLSTDPGDMFVFVRKEELSWKLYACIEQGYIISPRMPELD